MFSGCGKLNYIKALFLTKPSGIYTPNWVEGVAGKGTFIRNPEAAWDVRGVSGIPEGWTVGYLDAASLPRQVRHGMGTTVINPCQLLRLAGICSSV